MNEYKFKNIIEYSKTKKDGFFECDIYDRRKTTIFVKTKETSSGIRYKIIPKTIVTDDYGNEKEADNMKAYYVKRIEYTLRVLSDNGTYEDIETYNTTGYGEIILDIPQD